LCSTSETHCEVAQHTCSQDTSPTCSALSRECCASKCSQLGNLLASRKCSRAHNSLMLFCSGVPAVGHWTWRLFRITLRVSVEKSQEKTTPFSQVSHTHILPACLFTSPFGQWPVVSALGCCRRRFLLGLPQGIGFPCLSCSDAAVPKLLALYCTPLCIYCAILLLLLLVLESMSFLNAVHGFQIDMSCNDCCAMCPQKLLPGAARYNTWLLILVTPDEQAVLEGELSHLLVEG